MPSNYIMVDIINGGGGPHYFTQQEAEAYSDKEDGNEPWENGEYSYIEVAEEELEDVPMADLKGKKKKKKKAVEPKKKVGGSRPNWSSREDECLTKSWKMVSINPFTALTKTRSAIGRG
jgi:hypothetical protein